MKQPHSSATRLLHCAICVCLCVAVGRADELSDNLENFCVYGEQDVLGYAEPATWHVVTRGVELDSHLDCVLLSPEGKTSRIVDELRIGPTWRSVVPIQENVE